MALHGRTRDARQRRDGVGAGAEELAQQRDVFLVAATDQLR
jgi:hypothetical protein